MIVISIDFSEIQNWFPKDKKFTGVANYLILLASLFYLLRLTDVVQSLLSGETPETIIESGLLTNPIHVLDMSIVLPAFIITALSLKKGKGFSYLFAPSFPIFSVIMSISLLILLAYVTGSTSVFELPLLVIFGLTGALSSLMYWSMIKSTNI